MRPFLNVKDVRFTRASEASIASGLFGFVSCVVNGSLVLDGIAVRQTGEARLTLSFPARRDASGRQRFPVRPVDDLARRSIEQQVFRIIEKEHHIP